MKIKVQLVEGFWTTNWREPIEIETDDYEELKGLSEDEAYKYVEENSHRLAADPKETEDSGFTIHDWATEQDVEYSKEKNYDCSVERAS